jgi:hypothetical protein
MSGRLMKVCVAGGLLISALVGASSASAEWTTNGNSTGLTLHATAGPSLLNVSPVGGAVQGLSCPLSSLDVHLYGPSLASGNTVGHVTPTFTRNAGTGTECQAAGVNYSWRCTPTMASLNAVAYYPLTGITVGNVSSIHCQIVKLSGACGNATTFNATGSASGAGITVSGQVPGTYTNGNGQLTVTSTGQSLSALWSSPGCLQGTGTGTASGQFSGAGGAELVYTTTGTRGTITN